MFSFDVFFTGMSAQAAVERALDFMNERVLGAGGAICITRKGEIGFHFTTQRMAWAFIKQGIFKWGLNPGEMCQEYLK